MRLFYVVQRYGKQVVGGAEAACRQLATRVARSADVTVFTTCARESTTWANHYPPGEQVEDGVRVVRFPTVATRDSSFERLSRDLFSWPDPPLELQRRWVGAQGPKAPELVEEISRRSAEPDLWVFYTYLYYPIIFGLPLVASRALLHPALHDEPPARLPIVRALIRSAAALSVQTEEEWELTLRLAGWPPGRLRLVGMGIEDGQGDVEAFRSGAGLGSDPYLLYMGRVDRGKGTDELARSFAHYKARHPGPLKLVIAGPLIHRPPDHNDIVLTGALGEDERWSALEGCEVFVHPSGQESFGIVLLEAWLKGKPALVSSRSRVLAGHARRCRGGLPYGDLFGFEAALEVVLDDPVAARRLGANGRAYAERFLWDRVLPRYESFLEEVAGAVAGSRHDRGP